MRAGRFRPADPALHERAQAYLDELEARGRYTHMVWPVHCEIGSWGHGLHPVVLESVQHWQQQRSRAVTTVFKGMHPLTEHYSALRAEVPDPADPASQLNTALVGRIADAGGQVVVAGEASTHCVAATMRDLFEVLPKEHLARFVLLTDCMSPVANSRPRIWPFWKRPPCMACGWRPAAISGCKVRDRSGAPLPGL